MAFGGWDIRLDVDLARKLKHAPGHCARRARAQSRQPRPAAHLVLSVPHARYSPELQPVYNAIVNDAVNRVPDIMAAELAQHKHHNATKG